MTDYASMTIDNLISYRDQWPAQQSEWNRAELALQKRLAVKYAYLDLAEELRDEGLMVTPAIRSRFLTSGLDELAIEAAIDAVEQLMDENNGSADGSTYIQTAISAYIAAAPI